MLDKIAYFANSLDEEGYIDDAEVLDDVLISLAQINNPEEDLTPPEIEDNSLYENSKPIIRQPELNPVKPTPSAVNPVNNKPEQIRIQNPDELVKNFIQSTVQNMLNEGFDKDYIYSEQGKQRMIQEMSQSLNMAGL